MEEFKDLHPWLWSSILIVGTLILALLARFLIVAGLKRIDGQDQSVFCYITSRTAAASWRFFPLVEFLIALPGISLPLNNSACVKNAFRLGLMAADARL